MRSALKKAKASRNARKRKYAKVAKLALLKYSVVRYVILGCLKLLSVIVLVVYRVDSVTVYDNIVAMQCTLFSDTRL